LGAPEHIDDVGVVFLIAQNLHGPTEPFLAVGQETTVIRVLIRNVRVDDMRLVSKLGNRQL
jgi:hypothetical protein